MATKLTDTQLARLIKFKEDQIVDESINEKVMLDRTTGMYIFGINGTYEFINKSLSEKIIENKINFVPREALLRNLKIVSSTFDVNINKEFYTDKNGKQMFNTFDETKTMLTDVDKIRKEYGSIDKINISQYKNINILLNNLFGQDNIEDIHYFLNWLATIVQTRKKMRTTIVMKGEPGAGKGLLEELISKMFYYSASLGNAELKDEMNKRLIDVNFVFFNEIETRLGSDIDGKMKEMITKDTINTRRLYSMGVVSKNQFNVVFSTNKDKPFKLDMGDRRYTIFETGDNLNKICNTTELRKGLFEELAYFVIDLKRLNYDEEAANIPLDNIHKENIAKSTSTKFEILKKYLNNADYLEIEEEALDQQELLMLKNEGRDYTSDLLSLKENMKSGFIDVKNMAFLYELYLNKESNFDIADTKNHTKIGLDFNSLVPDKKRISVNGKRIVVRVLKKKFIDIENKSEVAEDELINIDGTTTTNTFEADPEVIEIINNLGDDKNVEDTFKYDLTSCEVEVKKDEDFIAAQEAEGNIMF